MEIRQLADRLWARRAHDFVSPEELIDFGLVQAALLELAAIKHAAAEPFMDEVSGAIVPGKSE